MRYKICYRCGKVKELSEFHLDKSRKDGHSTSCKMCAIEKTKSYYRKNKDKIKKYYSVYNIVNKEDISNKKYIYNKENKESIQLKNRKWYSKNREHVLNKQKKYNDSNKENRRKYSFDYRKNNREKINENKRDYQKRNKHSFIWRGLLKRVLKENNFNKTSSTQNMLGYSKEELKIHIEKQFENGMTWNNHGEWHIDHIKPVKTFDRNTPPSVVNALSNLRPLWATTRIIDGVEYIGNLNRNKK